MVDNAGLDKANSRDGAGYFYDPTVLADVPEDARLLKEEDAKA